MGHCLVSVQMKTEIESLKYKRDKSSWDCHWPWGEGLQKQEQRKKQQQCLMRNEERVGTCSCLTKKTLLCRTAGSFKTTMLPKASSKGRTHTHKHTHEWAGNNNVTSCILPFQNLFLVGLSVLSFFFIPSFSHRLDQCDLANWLNAS